jgi:predicted dehydrogenase
MKTVTWGILSTGTIANKFAATVSRMKGEAVIGAVASRGLDTARGFAGTYGIPKAFGSYGELASDPEIDLIYVGTPHSLHYENMMLCLRAGKHVLCEKSFTVSAAQAEEVYAFARERGLFVMEAFWTRFIPAVRKLKELLEAKVIGEVNFITVHYGFRNDARRSRKLDPKLAGGALLDIGVYNIGVASLALGYEPGDILTTAALGDEGTDLHSAIVLTYPGGKFAQLTTAIQSTLPQQTVICGTNGFIRMDSVNGPQRLELAVDGQQPQIIELPFEHTGFEYQIREAQNCVLSGKTASGLYTPEQSVAVMKIMDRVRSAWGKRVPGE